MTQRTCAIAQAIAALEGDLDFFESMAQAQANNGVPVTKDLRERIAKGREALASLRSLAPAPADQNDAGRNAATRQQIALYFCTHTWAASERSTDPTIACEACCKKADAIIRDLAGGACVRFDEGHQLIVEPS